jgi:2-polyprenyl-3-methyl-5-hydroxy-6-metoxy-1,4-benzoquinol methylase
MDCMMKRCREPEIMDEPDIEKDRLFGALDGIARLNRWSGASGILWPVIRDLAREVAPRPLRVLDLASGGGDLLLGLWRRAARAGISLELVGSDLSPHAVDFAREEAAQAGAPIEYQILNAVTDPLPDGFDLIMSSLFMHHLDPPDVVTVLRRMADAAEHMVLVNDLIRTGPCWLLITLSARALCRSPVNHVDARRSAAAAFTSSEMRLLANQAGLADATITMKIPCRFLLTWRKTPVEQLLQPSEALL